MPGGDKNNYDESKSPPLEGSSKTGMEKTASKDIVTHIGTVPIYRNFTYNLPRNSALSNRSKALRKAGNLPEIIFWKQVHKGKFHKIDFDRQRVIGNFIVDFYVKTLSLVVEIDGSSHINKEKYDQEREEYLKNLGLRIYRIPSSRVRNELKNVMQELERFIVEHFGKK
ncbi:endonuclease domain-containing protein [Zunongwangia sp. F260]|uniref:Endonuclease domain-containing protein n=1 Tax=Autumnicola lenta TaxID=3075593 RepID=A0ABU3CJQ3_9FLAO|nr:endonuclease domain-containing protein [Zunongwangia sp. F260]MDT0646531.1 endonuclease domain-containing protein [Zunongwangia sp. F260]